MTTKAMEVRCCSCNRLKIDEEIWIDADQIEEETVSHGICPDCHRILYMGFLSAKAS